MSYIQQLKNLLDKYEIGYESEGIEQNEKVTINFIDFENAHVLISAELKHWESEALKELEWHGCLSANEFGGSIKEMWITHKIHKPVE